MTTHDCFYDSKLGAGLGLIEETRALLDLWQPGMEVTALYQSALHSGRFPTVSARRLRNIVVECFAPRYLVNDGAPARFLRKIEHAVTSQALTQLLFLHTCRANPILADFVRQVYWPRYTAGQEALSNHDARGFVRQAIDHGKTRKPWSESMIKHVSSYLTGCCADYGLLERGPKSTRIILPFRLESTVAAYLAYDLHCAGLGDNRVIGHQDWALFGLERADVHDELKRLALTGYVIVQSAGEVIRIDWRYPSMEAFTDVLAHG